MAAAEATKSGDNNRPIEITSEDIDRSKFSFDNLKAMRTQFPTETDTTLARFLIARSDDLTKARDLLAKHLDWRKANLPVSKNDCLHEFNKGKIYSHGFDKMGHPLVIWRGALNVAAERDMDELGKAVIWWMDYVERNMPANKSKITIICDRTDMSSANGDIEFIKHIASYFQDNFPERMYTCIIYPSGFLFYGLWNIVKWFLDPVTANKVQPHGYLTGVQEFIADDNIPNHMGGECTFNFNPDDFQDPPKKEEAVPDISTLSVGGGGGGSA